MTRGKNLQEMENAVTKNAIAGDKAMPKLTTGGTSPTWEDLGGPTPFNSKPDDDSNKVKTGTGVPDGAHGKNLKSVKGHANGDPMKGLTAKDALKSGDEVEVKDDQEIISEDETTTEEVVAENPEVKEEKVEEEVVQELPEINDEVDVEEDVNALLGGEELSEDFRDKAKTIFEAALKTKAVELREALEKHHEAKLVEEVKSMKGELIERMDSYLEYVADEWFTANSLQVEAGLKTEMTESFLTGMKSLFEEHYVSIPEEKYDVVANMVEKLDDMETKLNEQIEKNISINKRLAEATAGGILADVSEGLSTSQKDKLSSLSEGVEFESEESYKEKLETLKESYFKNTPKRTESEVLTEESNPSYEGAMDAYMQALGQAVKK
jgi:hypothetical protein